MFNFSRSTKRKLTGAVLAMHLFSIVSGSLLFPTPASAVLGVGDVSITAADIPRIAGEVLINALKQVGSAIKVTVVEVATYLGQKVAHDAAVQLVAGASGQKPLFNPKDAGQYMEDLGKDVAAQTLSGFVDHLANIDICTFDPKTQLTLALGFAGTIGPQGRRCDFKALSKRFDQIKNEVATFSSDPQQGFASRFSVQFVPGNSTLDGFTQGVFGTFQQVNERAEALKMAELLDRLGSIKSVKDPVTGAVKTPKEVLAEKILDDAVKKPARDIERNIDAALKAAPDEILTIIGLSAKAFVSTLLGEATKKIYAGLAPTSNVDLGNPFGGSGTGIADAQQALRSLLAVQPAAVAQYDAIGSFSSCPQGAGMHRNPDTCVMDQQFAAAVRRGTTTSPMTIKEARDAGFLRADFPFIGPNDARNQDPTCYLQGYCYSNLVKLRRARVISIGWEMAAIVAERERPGTTLGEVIDSFAGANLVSFKHLIDPNWILKYPPTQCRQMVNGATLLSDRTPNRHEVCVDTPSCIREDGNGNCLDAGYGYCTEEKNVWRFDGDSCPAEMSSCLSFTRPGGGTAAYLTNTLDASACTAGNAGCRNYLLDATPAAQPVSPAVSAFIVASTAGTGSQITLPSAALTSFFAGDLVRVGTGADATDVSITKTEVVGDNVKLTVSGVVTWEAASTPVTKLELTGQSIYLNKNAGTCPTGEKGCTELVNLTTRNTPANMLRNPSFETDENADNNADGWTGPNVVLANATEGGKSMTLAATQTVSQYITLQGNSFYTFSAALRMASGNGTASVTVSFQQADGTSIGALPAQTLNVTNAYTRPTFTFSTPNSVSAAQTVVALVTIRNASSSAMNVDAVQIEYGEIATAFHNGYSADVSVDTNKVYMKVPPAALNCTGASTDDPECRNYAGMCLQGDVGCERYTPTNGDSAVNGSLSRLDLCPAACVGYDTFKQLGYDDATTPGAGFERAKFPVFLSPTFPGARSCSVAAAGCDEFTNLERAAQGGEAREYYSKLRKCQVESTSTDTATYYTWEGSDTAGLQLKTWKLKKTQLAGNGPCTNARYGADGTSATLECVDTLDLETSTGLAANQPTCKEHNDVALNPDCREFYDADGVVHYRLLSQTIISADACTQLRKTSVAAGAEGQADCSLTGGRWAPATGECMYSALPSASTMCNAVDNGCRAYRGNAGSNTRVILNQTFETVTPSAGGVIGGYAGTYSNESLAANGHSLRSAAGRVAVTLTSALQAGKTYQISFWAKANATLPLTASLVFNSSQAAYPLVNPTATLEWQRFVSDSVTIASTQTELNPEFRITGGDFFVDNIEIREVQNVVAFIKGSWTVPASCDQTPEGAASPQEMLGCREYTDRVGTRVTARSFSRLCSDGAVGCKAFVDTQNSTPVGQQVFSGRCYASQPGFVVSQTTQCSVKLANGTTDVPVCQVLPGNSFCRFNTNEIIRMAALPPGAVTLNTAYQADDTIVVPSDMVKYLIDDPSKRCDASSKGCYEFGAAQYGQDHESIVGVGKKTLLNLPDQYASTLCGQEANFCDAFSGADGSVKFFKDPEAKVAGAPTVPGKLCEYRDDVLVNGVTRKGWFRKDTDLPCYDDFIVAGTFNGIRKNADPNYQSWGGSCAPAMSLCTEFRDPTDKSTASPLGKSYFFLKNARVTSATCNQVSRSEGCALFEDTTNPTKMWQADASYAASDARGGALTSAVSCETDPGNVACKNRCRLSFADITGAPEPTRLVTSQLCVRNEDCSGMTRDGKRVTDAVCVDITDSSNTTSSTYESTRDANIGATHAVTADNAPLNNVNMMLRVRRDRECGEWLTCTTSSPVYDSVKQETKEICNEVRTCNDASGSGLCASFVETPREPLTRGVYQERDVSWKAGDMSGYTVPGVIPLDRVGQVNVAGVCEGGPNDTKACFAKADCNPTTGTNFRCAPNPNDPDLRVAQRLGTSICTGSASNGDSCQMGYCVNNPTLTCSVSTECGTGACSMDSIRAGRCYDGACVQLVGNSGEVDDPRVEEFDVMLRQPEALACRAYPENDGPVAATTVEEWKKTVLDGDIYTQSTSENSSAETVQWTPLRRNPQFNGANVCSFAKTPDGRTYRMCECSYAKATYGSATIVKYYPQGTRSRIKPYICAGGPLDGAACTPSAKLEDDPCGPEGQCTALKKIDNAQGVSGYCLQRDLSVNVNGDGGGYGCALWLPVDALPGSVDIYNQDEMAGFVPPEDDLYMCTESQGRSAPNKAFTEAPYVGTLVNEASAAGVICQETGNGCNSRTTRDVCNQGGYCKWVDGACKILVIDVVEPPDPPPGPPGCGEPTPANECNFSPDSIFGSAQNPKFPPEWPTSGSCCVNDTPDCPQWYRDMNGGSCGAPTYKECGSAPVACQFTPPATPSLDVTVDSCVDLDKVILTSTITGLAVGFMAYGPVGAALGGLAGAPLATIATAKCAELATIGGGICGMTQRYDRFAFTAIPAPVTLPPGLSLAGFANEGASTLRRTQISRANQSNFNPAIADQGTVPLYGELRNAVGDLIGDNGVLPANSIRRDEVAAIRVTTSGGDPETSAVPRTFFLLPPNFEASFWWNGGTTDDTNRTDDGKAISTNSFTSKCGDDGIQCEEKNAIGRSCDYFFTDGQCQNLRRDITPDNKGIENCAAIRGVFTGDFFNGTESGMCIRSNTHGGSLPVKIDVLLKESCNVISQVARASDTSIVPSSVAFTDRVWSGGGDPKVKMTPPENGIPLLTPGRGSETQDPFYPYGALAFRGNDVEKLKGKSVALYALLKSLGEGPFQPMKAVLPTDAVGPDARKDFAVTTVAGSAGQPQGGYTYDNRSGNTEYAALTPKGTVASLEQMFARTYGALRWNSLVEGGSYSDNALVTGTTIWDVRNPDSAQAAGMSAPKVYPIQQGSCRASDGKCLMDLSREGSVTVNDRNDGAITGSGSVKATVKFYFEADKDHAPTKRIVIDWGDRTDTTDLSINYGLYKNRVGLREDGTLGCDGDTKGTGFGRSARGCENAYIAFSHTYTCDDTTFSLGLTPVANGLLKGKPVSDTAASKCIFKPRVMIMDNWGWCNGVCSGDPIVSNTCYSGPINGNTNSSNVDQCSISALAEGFIPNRNPWAAFAGSVEVRR